MCLCMPYDRNDMYVRICFCVSVYVSRVCVYVIHPYFSLPQIMNNVFVTLRDQLGRVARPLSAEEVLAATAQIIRACTIEGLAKLESGMKHIFANNYIILQLCLWYGCMCSRLLRISYARVSAIL